MNLKCLLLVSSGFQLFAAVTGEPEMLTVGVIRIPAVVAVVTGELQMFSVGVSQDIACPPPPPPPPHHPSSCFIYVLKCCFYLLRQLFCVHVGLYFQFEPLAWVTFLSLMQEMSVGISGRPLWYRL